ncbi:dTDP-4-dehydrorhamnose reductase [Syntrophaceticus schinkii]|uniref:dTDP-4-dehydrorhamnose reductase n=1 Tax=Syntrophaceticus schinkii TaxID=499207 RepID=A0A0B7MKD6_9FIRM|nr:dTDP-4-dehydrorhamnose reductase [Syntrophaceticus schinkii]CEO88411.1 Spore coat polysaccharide biosynthesis protein spsK [Syntrophaceticus schinkii]
MRVLVTGADGQLGYDMVKTLNENSIECLETSINELDITNEAQTNEVITNYYPDVVVHCAAYTAVDKAEDERELCYNVNVLGTKYVAAACKAIDAKMVYISTDYVFDGEGDQPFEATDQPNPINYYGKTKYEGELEVQKLLNTYFIIRISWVFGQNGNNFVKTMLRLAKERDEISVVADQIGSPTYTYDLTRLVVDMIQTEKYGIYHATNEGYCSWYEFASEIFKQAGLEVKVKPIKTEDYITKAKRPKNSRLSKRKLAQQGFSGLKEWEGALREVIKITEK